MIRILLALCAAAATATAALPPGCTGSAPLGTFQLLVRPFSNGEPLPLKGVAEIPGGSRLIWNPLHLLPPASGGAEVTAVLVPGADGDLITLEPRKAAARTEWQLPERPQVIALLFGPEGLSEGKIKSLVTHNRDLLRELADYAEQSSQVESLVQQLANAEEAGRSADAVLKGFSSQFGVDAPKLDTKASSDQQAALLLKALLPASTAYDPLAGRGTPVQQSGGLAASVAGMFFGNPVALAAGGAALFQNLKTAMFPGTDFRSAFAQAGGQGDLALCTKTVAAKPKSRTVYLWAYRVPEVKKPVISLVGTPHVPLGSQPVVAFKLGAGSSSKVLGFARNWRLVPVSSDASIPIAVQLGPSDALELDLSNSGVPAGAYRLAATWDWDPLTVEGTLDLRHYSDFAHVMLAAGERDKLVEGNGTVAVRLTGADFEFLETASVESSTRDAKLTDANFTLPGGKRAGPQDTALVYIDTAKRGSYRLLLAQSDGVAHEVPLTVLPPNPKISNIPIRLNVGDAHESLHLEGSGLDRVEAVSSDAGEITGAPDVHGWSGEIALKPTLNKGQRLALTLKIHGLENPLSIPDAIEIVGPRPRIVSMQKALAGTPGIEIGADELPAGTAAGLVLTVDHLKDGRQPRVDLSCQTSELRHPLDLSPGETSGGASLAFAGPGALYLSVDPGAVGYAGCALIATVTLDPEGRSDAFTLGRVIRIPRLDKFTLSGEKVGDASYAGSLEGRDLDVIEKVGWDAQHGAAVQSIPTPLPADPARQTLRVVLPWPAPGPHAPLYVWLRGETVGRKTTVGY